jgi:O-methyltransferase
MSILGRLLRRVPETGVSGTAEMVEAPRGPETKSTPVPSAIVDPAATEPPAYLYFRQFIPHVLMASPEKHALVNEAATVYSAVPVEDEPSGLSTDPIRVLNFFLMIEAANKLPEGDYLELGSHRGFSTRVIHRFMDPQRTLYAFDTVEGFDLRDIKVESEQYDSPWQEGNFGPTSVERVARYVGNGNWPSNLKLVKGWFPDSFRGHEHLRWRFVHIDFDLYQPIKAALETVWDRMLPGGVVLVHDYGAYGFPAARKAVDEFCRSVGQAPIELSDRWSTAAIRKPFAI